MIENKDDLYHQTQSYSGSSSPQGGEKVSKKHSEKLIATPIRSMLHSSSMNTLTPFSLSDPQLDNENKDSADDDRDFYILSSTRRPRTNTMKASHINLKTPISFQLRKLSNHSNNKPKETPTILKCDRLTSSPIKEPIKKQLTNLIQSDNKRYSLQSPKEIKEMKSKRRASPIIIQSIIKENIAEIKAMTNTEEISDFYEYNEACMKMIDKLKPVCASPPQIDLPFAKEIPTQKRLAVFDLDETLVHAQLQSIETAQYTIKVRLPSNKIAQIGLNIRPHWQEALDQIGKNYYIIVYTATDHSYTDAVLDFMDPNNYYFKYRLYRNNCSSNEADGQRVWVKDLNIFKGIDLKDIVIIDNSSLSYAFHLKNGIPILPYYDSKKDFELIFLADYLNSIVDYEDLRKANERYIKYDKNDEEVDCDDDGKGKGNGNNKEDSKESKDEEEQVLMFSMATTKKK